MKRLAIIGGGFMGSALVEGLLGSGWRPPELIVAERQSQRTTTIREHLKVDVCADAADAARQAGWATPQELLREPDPSWRYRDVGPHAR